MHMGGPGSGWSQGLHQDSSWTQAAATGLAGQMDRAWRSQTVDAVGSRLSLSHTYSLEPHVGILASERTILGPNNIRNHSPSSRLMPAKQNTPLSLQTSRAAPGARRAAWPGPPPPLPGPGSACRERLSGGSASELFTCQAHRPAPGQSISNTRSGRRAHRPRPHRTPGSGPRGGNPRAPNVVSTLGGHPGRRGMALGVFAAVERAGRLSQGCTQ